MKTPILHKTQELVAPESIYLQWEGVPILERSGSHDSCYQYLSSNSV